MDLLFRRYADPFSFINQMISCGRFVEWVDTIWNTICAEKEEKTLWEFFLHKINNKTFLEWKNEVIGQAKNEKTTESDLETTVKESMSILEGFNPETEGGVKM